MTTREGTLKTILWGIMGALSAVTVARFGWGLGATTALTDVTPWGLWIAFDVMAGVALAAGGFVIAFTVYIFGLEKYRPFVRPAILTAFLGYVAVAAGLVYDLGLPWHIWHPITYPQPRSALFEVAMCVMLYLTVLLLEFSPVLLEHSFFQGPFSGKILAMLRKATIPLVIFGIVLSTLHQSSLGSLFLIAPHRVHPLWYSPLIWVLYLASAIGVGLMMIVAESYFSAWLFGHTLRMDLLQGLGKAASIVLFFYAALRIGDLIVRGKLSGAFDGSWQSSLFILEISISALIPAVLLAIPRVRRNQTGLAICSAITVLGVMGYRFNTCIVTFARPGNMSYFPRWTEIAVSAGIVATCILVFIFFAQHLRVFSEEKGMASARPGPPAYDEKVMNVYLPCSMAAAKKYSLAAVVGAALTLSFLPENLLWGSSPIRTPVHSVRVASGWKAERIGRPGSLLSISDTARSSPKAVKAVDLYIIDANRNGRLVLFHHKGHETRLGEGKSCSKCHHINLPFHKNTTCHHCHRDMYLHTDIFSHSSHILNLGGNEGCSRCHSNPGVVKNRKSARNCRDCHRDMLAHGSLVQPPLGGLKGFAVGYMDAMHGLCIKCHQDKVDADHKKVGRDLADCNRCHMGIDGSLLQKRQPYGTPR